MLPKPLSTGALAVYEYSDTIREAFSLMDKYGNPLIAYALLPDGKIGVPRNMVQLSDNDVRTTNQLGPIEPAFPPKNDDQKRVIAETIERLKNGESFIVDSPTGSGKSYMGMAAACAVGETTLIVVPKQDLMGQWYRTLTNLGGIHPNDIGFLKAQKPTWEGKRFVLGMVQTLMKPNRFPKEAYDYFGLVIFDEVHRVGADKFSQVCQLFPSKLRLGLSATPNRPDGKDVIIRGHIGNVLVKGEIIPMVPKIIIQRTGFTYKGLMPDNPSQLSRVHKAMGADEKRNKIIVDFVLRSYEKGRSTLVLSELIEDHLRILREMLAKEGLGSDDVGLYIGKQPKNQLLIEAAKPIILGTYQMTAEGTDFPHWDTLVFATPRANIKQPLGRILRFQDGKKQPICLDLVDEGWLFGAFAGKRQRTYRELCAEVVNYQLTNTEEQN